MVSGIFSKDSRISPYPGACVRKKGDEAEKQEQPMRWFDGSYHSLQLTRLKPPPLPEVGLPDDVQLADHSHALDDPGLLRVLRLRLQAVEILPGVWGLQVGHFPEGALPGRDTENEEEWNRCSGLRDCDFALLLRRVSACDHVELCDVVHHGRLERDFLHEHGRGGDVLDLSLQEDFVCLERQRAKSKSAPT